MRGLPMTEPEHHPRDGLWMKAGSANSSPPHARAAVFTSMHSQTQGESSALDEKDVSGVASRTPIRPSQFSLSSIKHVVSSNVMFSTDRKA
jgi:hypothetical protein